MKQSAALALLACIPSMNILRIAAAVQPGETVTIGSTVFEIKTLGHTITPGRVAVDLTAAPTAARASLVFTFAGNPTAADTVTVGGKVYTFRASVAATANEVLIGIDLTATRNNLVAAINGAAGGGTTYGSATTANANVTAVATSTNAATVSAIVAGTVGNAIVTAEAGSNTSWAGGAVLLAGGVDPTAAEAIDALVIAFNSTTATGFRAVEGGAGEIIITAVSGQEKTVATTETLAGSNNAWAAATTFGGRTTDDPPVSLVVTRAATAAEVALGQMRFPLNFAPAFAIGTLRTSAGVLKAWDGATTFSGNTVTADVSGSSDFAAGDLVSILVSR